MSEIVQAFLLLVSVSLYSIPSFVLIFFLKCVDLYSYKKLGAVPKMTKHVFFSLGIICIGNLILIGVQSLPILFWGVWLLVGFVFSLFFVPIMTILTQIVLYLVERKSVNDKFGKVRPITLSLLINVVMSMLYNVLYYCIMQWNMHGAIFSSDIDAEPFTMDHFDIIIGAILLMAIFVAAKILIQAILVKRVKKKIEQQQLTEKV